jgi:hypothetical protein
MLLRFGTHLSFSKQQVVCTGWGTLEFHFDAMHIPEVAYERISSWCQKIATREDTSEIDILGNKPAVLLFEVSAAVFFQCKSGTAVLGDAFEWLLVRFQMAVELPAFWEALGALLTHEPHREEIDVKIEVHVQVEVIRRAAIVDIVLDTGLDF